MDAKEQKAEEDRQINLIKSHMPGVYQLIRERAASDGNGVYMSVRRAARGEPDCFYAIEGGRVVGTPFVRAVTPEIAQLIVQFGVTFLCMLPARPVEENHGSH